MAALQQIECNISHSCQRSELRSWLGGAKQKWRDASQVTKEMHNKSIGSIEIAKGRGSWKEESKARLLAKKNRLLAKYSSTIANYEGEILHGAGKAWSIGDHEWFIKVGGVLYCMAGELWASVFGFAIMRSSLATLVPSRTEVGTTAVGLDIWNVDTHWPTFCHYPCSLLFSWCRTNPGHQSWQICNVYRKEKQFCSLSFSSHK